MKKNALETLKDAALSNRLLEDSYYLDLLNKPNTPLLPLLEAAYTVRQKTWQNKVTIHIINNAQNGLCPEDCSYCAQSKSSKATIEKYPAKEADEMLREAKSAHERGAHRYCMVFSGRGPSAKRVARLCKIIKTIKKEVPIELCLSAGLIDIGAAKSLKEAGLDRLNHNLNTSKENYPKICSTHSYADRLNTLKAAQLAGIERCSGLILGMGEKDTDVLQIAKDLRALKTASIPVNFLIPIEGTSIPKETQLSPDYCIRTLCLFRFINPKAEIRIAAGREYHLRSLEPLALYPANSLFLDGYLNTKGSPAHKTLAMISDLGFDIESDVKLSELLDQTEKSAATETDPLTLKNKRDLRPSLVQ